MRLSPGVPVLWRGDDRAQVGIARPVDVRGDDARVAAALEGGLASAHQVPAVLAERLRGAGVLEGETTSEPSTARVRVRGLGAIGTACAVTLARAGAAALSLVDPGSAAHEPPGTYPAFASGGRAARAARAVAGVRLDVEIGLGDDRTVDAEVVVAVGSAGALRAHALAVAGLPHVGVLTDEAGASIIPVLPGRTPCLRCRDLALADADPAWPLLARQCEARDPWCDPATTAVAGAVAAATALALLAPRPRADAIRAWRIEAGLPRALDLAPHPDCGCLD